VVERSWEYGVSVGMWEVLGKGTSLLSCDEVDEVWHLVGAETLQPSLTGQKGRSVSHEARRGGLQ
jgi:hypothetical protein